MNKKRRLTPDDLTMSISDAYSAYRKLRGNVAMKRFARIKESGYTEAGIYRDYAYIQTMPASKIAPSEIKKALSDLYAFIEGGSRIRDIKQGYSEASEALRASGYNIAPKDVPAFRRFMQGVTDRYGARRESSTPAAMYSELLDAGLMKNQKNREEVLKHFDWYRTHMDEVLKEARNSNRAVKLSDIRKKLL